jgi:enoyl-CoA hydratase/carnithine racemase
VAEDDSARVVVIKAAGKAFCAGHDLKEMRAEPSLAYYQTLFAQCGRMMMAIQRLPVPVIAVCRASPRPPAASWWRCATWRWRRATRASPSAVSTWACSAARPAWRCRNLGRKQAFEMLVTGDFISADEARPGAWSTAWCHPSQVDAEVEALVAAIVAKPRRRSPWARRCSTASWKWASRPPTPTLARPWPAT